MKKKSKVSSLPQELRVFREEEEYGAKYEVDGRGQRGSEDDNGLSTAGPGPGEVW